MGSNARFIENYLRPQFETIQGDGKGAQALFKATRLAWENRDEYERQSPDGCFSFLRRGSTEWKKIREAFKSNGH